ncbi:DUF3052 domain-containing protein [Ornithinimicrobium sp. F0845]|uniref:DUF3052 domain-containing protein n=1 Tax=Ornithinimicrobium sp. F0845 TaxID=2926412 RepID=UPI001FF201A5|nr:DUF3052 domain-containing protein [Ornithinimicrobium sp. F0845]MCK0114113.1 DUF3052 domain-containing protein [Ornithinimicrobium sp. F0845]
MANEGNHRQGGAVERLGFAHDMIVLEYGYDDDVDETFRERVIEVVGSPLEEEDYTGVVDAVLLWWRDGEGDLTDELVDCLALLEEGGFIALVTPGSGRGDRVPAHDVQEACATAGLTASGAVPLGDDGEWHAQRLVGRR